MHLVLDGAGYGAPRMIAAMTGTNQSLATPVRMSTRCARDLATQSVLIMGTNHVISFNLLFYHSRQLYGMLGQGASIFEFLPRSGDWDPMWYYGQDRDKEDMLTAQRAGVLRAVRTGNTPPGGVGPGR